MKSFNIASVSATAVLIGCLGASSNSSVKTKTSFPIVENAPSATDPGTFNTEIDNNLIFFSRNSRGIERTYTLDSYFLFDEPNRADDILIIGPDVVVTP